MNWHHWHNEVANQAAQMSESWRKIPDSAKPSLLFLVRNESRLRPLVDDICTRYIEVNEWPDNMAIEHFALIYFRLEVSSAYSAEMASHQEPLNQSNSELDAERPFAIRFLLVDYWHRDGWAKWRGIQT